MSRANDMAYPVDSTETTPNNTVQTGLTIREHFAAMAMQAIIGTAAAPCLTGFGGCEPNIAATAVGMADALIAELAKVKP